LEFKGTPVAFPFESVDKGIYREIHTVNDVVGNICTERCYEFYKLGLAYFLTMDKFAGIKDNLN